MDKNARIIAITRILPGLQTFLTEVLANETLSSDAEQQRLEIIKALEELTKPPVLPPRPANLKSQSRSSVESIESSAESTEKDFASVQRKLSNIFYLRRDFEEINEHLVNGAIPEEANKPTLKKSTPGKKKEENVEAKIRNKKHDFEGIYEDLQEKEDSEEFEVLSEEETPKSGVNRSLARGTHFRTSLGKSKWFTRKEKSITHEIFVGDLLLPSIAGHLMEVRTNKRRWCVLKDQHLYIFKNQEEPAYFVIDLPGCDISTVRKADKSKVSYSFKITQNGVAAVVLGIEEEKDLSAWMNALITASLAKTPLSPPQKMTRTLPRGTSTPVEHLEQDESSHHEIRRHTFGTYPFKTKDISVDIDVNNYEQPTEVMGIEALDMEHYNPPLPPLPGEIDELLVRNGEHEEGVSRSRIYEEVTEEFLRTISKGSKVHESEEKSSNDNVQRSQDLLVVDNDDDDMVNTRRSFSEVATSDSEYSSDEDPCQNERLFHDRWALHSGVLYQKKATTWNKQYCKIIDNTFKGFRNPDDQSPLLEMNLSGYHVRAAEAEGKRKFIFQINIADEECLYFNTDTKPSLERWIEVISIAATSRPETSLNLSEDELDKSAEIPQNDISHVENDISHGGPGIPYKKHEIEHEIPYKEHEIEHEIPYKENEIEHEIPYIEHEIPYKEHEIEHEIPYKENEIEHEIPYKEHGFSNEEHGISLEEQDISRSEPNVPRADSPPLPVPERVESLRRSRVLSENQENSVEKPATTEVTSKAKVGQVEIKTDDQSETLKGENSEEESFKSEMKEKSVVEDVWQRRSQKRNYHTAPRSRNETRMKLPQFSSNSLKKERCCSSNSPQRDLHISKKSQYRQRLQKYLDSKGQFSGFILELTIQPNSTNLTRRWAVVHDGFLRIYENYGCAVPFLKISLVEAFLKDFTNVEKSRYCFMLEYAAGKSIMLLTNTHKELERWMTVITLSIASHTDLFGSGLDLRRCDNQALLNSAGNVSYNRRTSEPNTKIATSAKREVKTSSKGGGNISEEKMNKNESTYDSCDVKHSIYDSCSEQEVTTQELVDDGRCDCRCAKDDGQVSVSCTPLILRKALHHKSYDMMTNSGDSDDPVGEKYQETYTTRSSPSSKYSGYLHVTRGSGQDGDDGKITRLRQFCEVKGSLFSIYDNDKCENPKEVFNLLYDKYQESPNNQDISEHAQNGQTMLSFSIKNDKDGVVIFDCDEKKDYKIWKKVLRRTALQDTCNSSYENLCNNVSEKVTSSNCSNRKRSSFRASLIEEESKHHDALRKINQDIANGILKCDCSEYKCHVYEVRNSGENKTIIRRWCVINNGVVRIFERETSREAVTELKQSSYCVKDVENPGDFPFSIQLDPVQKTSENSENTLVIQASNVNDFQELLKRLKIVCKQKLVQSKSESFLPTEKKKVPPLTHSKSDLSIRKEVKRIFSLARKSSKSDILQAADVSVAPLGHDTWPKVTRRERKSSRRALSDTSSAESPLRYSLVNDVLPDHMRCIYNPEQHYTGYLNEVRNSELCRSEVRKWCVLHEHQFSAYDDQATQTPSTVINLRTTQLVDMSHVYHNSFEFRVNNGVVKSYLFKATNDFQKWIQLLTEAISNGLHCKYLDTREITKGFNDGEDTAF